MLWLVQVLRLGEAIVSLYDGTLLFDVWQCWLLNELTGVIYILISEIRLSLQHVRDFDRISFIIQLLLRILIRVINLWRFIVSILWRVHRTPVSCVRIKSFDTNRSWISGWLREYLRGNRLADVYQINILRSIRFDIWLSLVLLLESLRRLNLWDLLLDHFLDFVLRVHLFWNRLVEIDIHLRHLVLNHLFDSFLLLFLGRLVFRSGVLELVYFLFNQVLNFFLCQLNYFLWLRRLNIKRIVLLLWALHGSIDFRRHCRGRSIRHWLLCLKNVCFYWLLNSWNSGWWNIFSWRPFSIVLGSVSLFCITHFD